MKIDKSFDVPGLVKDMNFLCSFLDALPENEEWTMDDLAQLDDVRHAALRLAEMAETVMKELRGES